MMLRLWNFLCASVLSLRSQIAFILGLPLKTLTISLTACFSTDSHANVIGRLSNLFSVIWLKWLKLGQRSRFRHEPMASQLLRQLPAKNWLYGCIACDYSPKDWLVSSLPANATELPAPGLPGKQQRHNMTGQPFLRILSAVSDLNGIS